MSDHLVYGHILKDIKLKRMDFYNAATFWVSPRAVCRAAGLYALRLIVYSTTYAMHVCGFFYAFPKTLNNQPL